MLKPIIFLHPHFIVMQCIAMHANNNTNNSRKENYNHSNFLFYNNNNNNKKAGVALCVVSAPPCPRE